jgi:hypothetical protein
LRERRIRSASMRQAYTAQRMPDGVPGATERQRLHITRRESVVFGRGTRVSGSPRHAT